MDDDGGKVVSTAKVVKSETNKASMSAKDEIEETLERTSDLVSHRYDCVVEYDEPCIIALFQKQNYKVSINFAIAVNQMVPTLVMRDTGAGPNLANN